MLYLIDGYNVTKADPATSSLSLEEQRDLLVARLAVRGRDLLGKGRLVVVFDGVAEGGAPSVAPAAVDVRFSRGESADDLIVRLAADSAEKVCLVSSDTALAARVRAEASRGRSVEVLPRESLFAGADAGRRRRKAVRYPASSVGIPAGGNRITEELKALWLPEATPREDEE